MKNKCAIFDFSDDKNLDLLFVKNISAESEERIDFKIAAADYYKACVNGETVFYGPARTAKGYAVLNEFSAALKKGINEIVIRLISYGAACYSNVKQPAFLRLTATVGAETYTESDFDCYLNAARVKNTQRYSFQRGFSEIYKFNGEDKPFYFGEKITPLSGETPEIIGQLFALTAPTKTVNGKNYACGAFVYDPDLPDWKDRSIYLVGNNFEGYEKSELYECMTEKVCRYAFKRGNGLKTKLKGGEYADFDLGRNEAGFITLSVNVLSAADVYITFDEMLSEKSEGIDPVRLDCCNVIKCELGKGEHTIESIEPYTAKYIRVIVENGEIERISAGMRLLENADMYKTEIKFADEKANEILDAARHTLAQNSFDILMDCPSRERAGWLNDQYYSSKAARLFSGNDGVLEASVLAEILDPGVKEIRKGMTPMCYPSEHINGEYIPNCCMWFALNACELLKFGRLKGYEEKTKEKLYGILSAFENFENSDGLLEDLESWVFVEWSVAGSKEYRCGINFPTNMLYYKTLLTISETFGDDRLKTKAEKLKAEIIEKSFDGEFFQDNRVRENGISVLKNHISETCQYFAFFSGVADKENFKNLSDVMTLKFGVNRDRDYRPEIGGSNIITGMLMRLDLLCDNGEFTRAAEEVKKIFSVMAETTGTLWEHLSSRASCDHAIASFAGYILWRAAQR